MLLFETIQIKDGEIQRLDYHNERLNNSRNELMCALADINLADFIQVPKAFRKGLVKCRVNYGMEVGDIIWEQYIPRSFSRFFLRESHVQYDHKYINRQALEELQENLPKHSCIIIVKEGFITDTSFSNLIFKHHNGFWYTPHKPLLLGTQREYLLDEELIIEHKIKPTDLENYSHFMLINAMLNFKEESALPVSMIAAPL
ncbi:MAG: hypothetical protein B7C24_09255 [Bacteroidetes bacterium 4572_77]|nr:MAG: hypothetical protein B7C24_09255 [Bacteroidetes bacterium 4572_77]